MTGHNQPDDAGRLESVSVVDIRIAPNIRREVDHASLQELAESIRASGLIQPVILRPTLESVATGGRPFDLIVGQRRLMAIHLLGWPTIPARIREMSDQEAAEIQAIENVQREDLDPIEEAEGLAGMMDRFGYSPDDLAIRLGKPASYVRRVLTFRDLPDLTREALKAGSILPTVAGYIGRIPGKANQVEATRRLVAGRIRLDGGLDPMGARQASEIIQREFMLRLSAAPFKPSDAELVPAAGSCSACPKRTGNQSDLFGDVKATDLCTDPACYRTKVNAAWKVRSAAAIDEGRDVLEGKAAEKLFGYGDDPRGDAPLVSLDLEVYTSRGYKSARAILGKRVEKLLPPPTLVRSPGDRFLEVYPHRDVKSALEAVGVKSQAPGGSPAERARARKEREKRSALRTFADQVIEKTIARPPVDNEEFWRAVLGILLASSWSDTLRDVVRRRGLGKPAGKGKERRAPTDWAAVLRSAAGKIREGGRTELRGLAVEILAARGAVGQDGKLGSGIRALALAHGIQEADLRKIDAAGSPAKPQRSARNANPARKRARSSRKGVKSR